MVAIAIYKSAILLNLTLQLILLQYPVRYFFSSFDGKLANFFVLQKGLYLHEIGHAVGLVHEHQRPIRDQFIRINYGNVHPSLRQWFQKYPQYRINNFNISYEFSSVMHYGITVRNHKDQHAYISQ